MSKNRSQGLFWLLCAILAASAVQGEPVWSEREMRILRALSLSSAGPPPPSPSNRVADVPAAQRLGARLFFDTRFSGNGELSCASCHQPGRYFTDGLPKSRGMGQTSRNAPSVVGSAYNAWFYWDGRRDSLWAQALIPIEAPAEMGGSRLDAVRIVGTDKELRAEYETLFGAFPSELLDETLPRHAGPYGDTSVKDAWNRLTKDQRTTINTVYSNLGKTIAAYERTLLPQSTRFDEYVAALLSEGVEAASEFMTVEEMNGLRLFIDSDRAPCLQCHNGPLFTNGGFHNVGSGNFEGESLDFGRIFGLRAVLMDEFNCLGPYSDVGREECMELRFMNRDSHIPLEGAFKVPTLRNLKATAPYFHDGRFDDLAEVIGYYRSLTQTPEGLQHEILEFELTAGEARELHAFLLTLSN